jgi:predicted amidohydrolase YtcJ
MWERSEMALTTIFTARRVITMNPANPEGTAIAVRDGRVLGVGDVDELVGWGEHVVDETFADKVLMPGFVEAHSHAMSGAMWQFPYVGFFDVRAPDGTVWTGCKTIDAVVERLKEIEAEMPVGDILLARGVDPLYFDGERMYAKHLDQVSTTRPIYIMHASGHLATVNTAMLERAEITRDTTMPGVDRDEHGEPNGELQEPPAMGLCVEARQHFMDARLTPDGILNFAYEARNAGHTTVIDLASGPLDEDEVAIWRATVDAEGFPARMMVVSSVPQDRPAVFPDLAARCADLKDTQSDRLRFGIVKLFLDGSIQGFTARVSWPYYYNPPEGHPGNGIWLTAPDQIADIVEHYHRAGLTVHCHCNGDEATEAFINAVETVLERYPRWDHRHTVTHCQLTTRAQYRRMKALGMCANIFSNHIFYWGDQHRDFTVGPERARGMDACASALREGVPFTIHSDAPVTPLGHLHTMWCAVNRRTATGQKLGDTENLSVQDALHAVTLGAAYQIKMDHDVGSLEVGKRADIAVLDEDPLEVDPMHLKDIRVWGTVLGGVLHPAGADS